METNFIQNYFSNIDTNLTFAMIFWVILLFSMERDRSRYRNCLFLALALLNTLPVVSSLGGKYSSKVSLVLWGIILLIIMIVPALLIANGIQMRKKEGHSLGNMLSLLLGIGVGIGEICAYGLLVAVILYEKEVSIDFLFTTKIIWIMLFISLSCVYLSLSFVIFMLYSLFLEIIPRKRDFDYVIIHGAGLLRGDQVSKLLSDRIDKAIEIYHKDPTPPIIIPSGGQGGDETISEAEAMKRYLLEKGIPEEDILMEDQSKTTLENLKFSKQLIDSRDGRKYTALVTSNYHVYRAIRYARKIGLKCTGIGSHVASYYWPSALIREYVAVHKEIKHLIILILGWLPILILFLLLIL